jgi:hypothetical protein
MALQLPTWATPGRTIPCSRTSSCDWRLGAPRWTRRERPSPSSSAAIERIDRKQKDLADKIRSDVAALRELQDRPEQDQSKITALAGEIEWSTRIFDERRKTMRYVCEVPTVIEQRTFALARSIRQALD